MAEKKVIITQKSGEPPVTEEILAQSIKKIADSFDKIARSGLSYRAIILLLSDASGTSKAQCRKVYEGLSQLRRLYLK